MYPVDVRTQIETELAQASEARRSGLEGRARVLSRRAAGIAIRSFAESKNAGTHASTTLDWIAWLESNPAVPEELRVLGSHLLVRVNSDYNLPIEADLIAEVRQLVDRLETILEENE